MGLYQRRCWTEFRIKPDQFKIYENLFCLRAESGPQHLLAQSKLLDRSCCRSDRRPPNGLPGKPRFSNLFMYGGLALLSLVLAIDLGRPEAERAKESSILDSTSRSGFMGRIRGFPHLLGFPLLCQPSVLAGSGKSFHAIRHRQPSDPPHLPQMVAPPCLSD